LKKVYTVAMFSWCSSNAAINSLFSAHQPQFRLPFQFLHVMWHLVKSTRRSLPISQPKYRSSQKTKQRASEETARGESTQHPDNAVPS